MEQLQRLATHLADRPAQLKKAREEGVKVVGYFPGEYVPEELIYASGAIPLCLAHGGNPRAVNAALSFTTRFLCPFSRAQFGEWLLKEQPYYNLVDMLLAPITCQHLRRAADLWEYYAKAEVFRLGIPHQYDSDEGLKYYIEMLGLLKEKLEGFTGNRVTEGKIERAIILYSRMRQLLKEISLMRKTSPPPLTSLDFIRLNHASFYADPDFMVELLASLAENLRQEREEPLSKEAPRLLLTGPNIAYGDYKIPELVEDAGGMIVVEEFCEGIRHYWENVEPGDDLIQALALRYLRKKLPCAFMSGSAKKRTDFLTGLAKEFDVAGVIWYQLKFCESYDIESYFFARKMEEIGMPVLKLESEYDISDTGPLRTRIEAFIETLRGGGLL